MSVIQTSTVLWMDSTARYTGRNFRFGALHELGNSAAGMTEEAEDSLTSVISDVEEEGEAESDHRHSGTQASIYDSVEGEIESGNSSQGISDEIVAAVARYLGIVESAMRHHRSTGTNKFDDSETNDDEDPASESFAESLTGDMVQNPADSIAATVWGHDRIGVLALLKH